MADTWAELDTMPKYGSTVGRGGSPKKKRVKYGADIVSWGNGAFLALKGNKTLEFWGYMVRTEPAMAAHPERDGIVAGLKEAGSMGWVGIAPNPLAGGLSTLSYSLPKAGPATVTVFDVAGRSLAKRTLLLGLSLIHI